MLYIVRHAQTPLNKLHLCQGRGLNPGLSPEGVTQSIALCSSLKDIQFKHIFVSSLQRTQLTVQPLIDFNPKAHFSISSHLDEISWGLHEGKSETTSKGERVSPLQYVLDQWNQGNLSCKPEGGESTLDVVRRLKLILPDIIEAQNPTLVCTHGRTMRMLLCLLTETPLTEQYRFPHVNTSLYVLEPKGNKFEIIRTNDTSHLNGKL